jgi:hypothetical protein
MQRGEHRGSRRQPVVDEDHRAAGHVGRRPVAAVGALAPLQLAPLLRIDRLDPLRRQAERLDHRLVEHADAAGRDRAERMLLVPGHPELAHQEHVERRTQLPSDLVRDRHAAPRQPEHDDVVAPRVAAQALREHPAGVPPVPELLLHRLPTE